MVGMLICATCGQKGADSAKSVCTACVKLLGQNDAQRAYELEERSATLEAAMQRASDSLSLPAVPSERNHDDRDVAEQAEQAASDRLVAALEDEKAADAERVQSHNRLSNAQAEAKRLALHASAEYVTAFTLSDIRASLASVATATEAFSTSLSGQSLLLHAFVLDITHPAGIARINSMRLCGKSTPWREANAAWGHVALLISALQAKTPTHLAGSLFSIDVLPTGSQATLVQRVEVPAGKNTKQIQKHSHALAGPPRLFSSAFDRATAVVALSTAELASVAYACDTDAGRYPAFSLPHAIENNGTAVGGRQLKLSDGPERFSAACQLLVSNLLHIQHWWSHVQPAMSNSTDSHA